jgi:hypothetical protein
MVSETYRAFLQGVVIGCHTARSELCRFKFAVTLLND